MGTESVDGLFELAAEPFRSRKFELAANLYELARLRETLVRSRRIDSSSTFSCRTCLGFLCEPVTLLCGHSFCKKCLEKEKKASCCREDAPKGLHPGKMKEYKVNVVLSNLLAKWFPSQLHAFRLKREGNGLYAEKKLEAALEKYNEAIHIAPKDHVLFSNRSQINSSLKRFEDALSDAEMACKLKPFWAKGHIRKAQAFTALGKPEEALTEYLISISFDPESKLAKTEAQKLLNDLIKPVRDHLQRKILEDSSLLSSRTRVKTVLASTLSTDGTAILPSSYKDYKSYYNNSVILSGSSTVASSTNVNEQSEHYKSEGGTEGYASITNRSVFLKRKHGVEEYDTARCDDGTCKRCKTDGQKNLRTTWGNVILDVIDSSDLECSLCMRLFYEPVTAPCGHTFCLKCLERCLDHNPKCPLCKQDLSEYLAKRQYNKTVLLEEIICKYFPAELVDRQKLNEEEIAELSNLNKNVPIFVCTMAFPTVPCPLHIFEPCYRLMIRRCMETGTKQFGMCLSDPIKGFADYGCLLEIRNVEFFADGRSVVDTIGKRRFKVVQHSKRDGYNTADIEYIEDIKVNGDAEAELQTLHDMVYNQAIVWVNSLKPEQKERIEGHFGSMPAKDSDTQASPNGPSWCWWLLAVLPLEGRAQLPFLALTSLKDRLTSIRRVLLLMARNRSR
ncbi:LON peptidase N-terminal domain and RING finger protein 3-like [Hoplias malabaricus]|uniref:LON peptidase N-terminal domain and RING finger protein 3-like n=1 Tax=Hoplias malabaricus TaxID=27720 RepID=UPI003462310C